MKKKNIKIEVIRENKTEEGFLDLTAYLSEADKVMVYREKDKITKEIIPLEELQKVAHQAKGLIMTDSHPTEFVNPLNSRNLIKGFVTEVWGIEDKKLKVDLRIIDKVAIDDVLLRGKREFSLGYRCDLESAPGVTEEGEAYDIVQTNLKLNHFGHVFHGRNGSNVGIIKLNEDVSYEDGLYEGGREMKISYKGKEYEGNELLEVLVRRDNELEIVTRERDQANGRLAALETENNQNKARLNGMDDEINKEVVVRLNAISTVATLTGDKAEDLVRLNSDELKSKVITKAYPEMNLAGKPSAYLDGLYEAAVIKLNEAEPNYTPATENKEAKRENGMNGFDRLAQAMNSIGGRK